MQKKNLINLLAAAIVLLILANCTGKQQPAQRWSAEKANEWYATKPWMAGANFIPSTAINQLEMWQAETFDTATINRELGWAAAIGMNVMRVYLHHVAWVADNEGFKKRMDDYLNIANKNGISTIFVFFDDCWQPKYKAGTQPEPKIGVHNSGWLRDPGDHIHLNPELVDTLEIYVKDVLTAFANDNRILMWDLYNEPGNSGYGNASMPLLKKVFAWARQINPSQPISAGVWNFGLKDLNKFQVENSDVISYHNYDFDSLHRKCIDTLKVYNRPLICTEYMARTRNSFFATITPMLKAEKVVAVNWGLVAGKTNTIYAWDSPMPDGAEPKVWFHDIFRKDGSPYSLDEINLIKNLTGKTE